MECSHCYVDYFLPLQSLYYLRLPDVGIRAMTQSKVVPLSPEKKSKYIRILNQFISNTFVIILLLFHLNGPVNGLVNN